MKSDVLQNTDLLSFTSVEQFDYGRRITLGDEVIEHNGKWTITALVYPLGNKTPIDLTSNDFEGRNFIVMRSWPNGDGKFTHQAILAEQLEETLREIDNSIIEALQPAYKLDMEGKS